MKKKIIRITTVPASLKGLLKGQLRFMSDYFEMVGVSSNQNGVLEQVGQRENYRTIPVDMSRKITPIKDLMATYKLYKVFKNEKPYIVHTHTPKAGTLGMLAAKLAGVPHRLHTIAGLPLVEATGIKRLILNTVEKITYACATKIYPNSYGLMDIILEHRFTGPQKLKVIGNGSSNGIDTQYFNPDLYTEKDKAEFRKSWQIRPDDFVFIFIGRLVADKGINELIESFVGLTTKHNHIKLLLVGMYESELDPLLPATTQQIDNNPNIVYTGWQDDVRPFFAIANALVFPSYREGFPNVVMQAGAMELPAIVSDINGCNEIVNHNKNGIIVPAKNTEKLYRAMESLLNKPAEDLKLMGQISRQHIVSNYDQQFVWKALLKEYQSL